MNYTLRPYQQKAVEAGIKFFKGKDKFNAVEVLPTGSGKSLVLANIIKELGEKTIVFQPSKEILEQNLEKILSYGFFPSVYSASLGEKRVSNITLATIGSVVNKPELFNEFKYAIVDECHLVSPNEETRYKRFFDNLQLKILGLTATPVRMKRYNYPYPHSKICMLDRMKPKFFQKYIHITQIQELVEAGFFADVEYFVSEFDSSKLQVNSTGGDYTPESIEFSLFTNSVFEKISELFIKNRDNVRHILIFVESVQSAYRVQELLGKSNCGIVTGAMGKNEREESLRNFKSGAIKAMVNCSVLTTGYDFPALDCVFMARPTMSLALYYQILGRCVRPHETKKSAKVFDLVGNFQKFGRISDFVVEQKNGLWVIHNGKNVLTNVIISEDNPIPEERVKSEEIMTFGKFKGQKLSDVPVYYLNWIYNNAKRDKYNEFVFKYVEENIRVNKK